MKILPVRDRLQIFFDGLRQLMRDWDGLGWIGMDWDGLDG